MPENGKGKYLTTSLCQFHSSPFDGRGLPRRPQREEVRRDGCPLCGRAPVATNWRQIPGGGAQAQAPPIAPRATKGGAPPG